MIRFECPSCKQTYTVPDQAGGRKGDCKKCGQRIEVPKPQRRRTILGRLVPEKAPFLPNLDPVRLPEAKPVPVTPPSKGKGISGFVVLVFAAFCPWIQDNAKNDFIAIMQTFLSYFLFLAAAGMYLYCLVADRHDSLLRWFWIQLACGGIFLLEFLYWWGRLESAMRNSNVSGERVHLSLGIFVVAAGEFLLVLSAGSRSWHQQATGASRSR